MKYCNTETDNGQLAQAAQPQLRLRTKQIDQMGLVNCCGYWAAVNWAIVVSETTDQLTVLAESTAREEKPPEQACLAQQWRRHQLR
jgi:hypothetical protein